MSEHLKKYKEDLQKRVQRNNDNFVQDHELFYRNLKYLEQEIAQIKSFKGNIIEQCKQLETHERLLNNLRLVKELYICLRNDMDEYVLLEVLQDKLKELEDKRG